jgi:predicted nuclease of restriction endonuclease-like (RecB) superfamily
LNVVEYPQTMGNDRENRASSSAAESSPDDYLALLTDVKERIRAAQIRAALSVNRELIQLYWDVGRLIVHRQQREGWGAGVIDRLASDLYKAFPRLEGFSASNISRMRAFFLAYTQAPANSAQAVPKSRDKKSVKVSAPQLGSKSPPPEVAGIPWGHNIVLLFKLSSREVRLWYAQQAAANGWSRSMLEHWIESDLYSRHGKAVTNFSTALPPVQSDLANEIMRDPYNFDFLELREAAAERELEEGLLTHIRKFLIELGAGFAFVGQQVHLSVDGEDYYIDLLFYHLKLRSYIVIDLKATPFRPEYVGKMNFYLSAVDDQLRHADDKLSIGLILCKTRSKVVAEYALRNLATPVGVARYTTKLVESLPAEFQGSLPSPKEIEAELQTQQLKSRQS